MQVNFHINSWEWKFRKPRKSQSHFQKKQIQTAQCSQANLPLQLRNSPKKSKQKLGEVWRELTWLISEGYVVEYADATLQANPYLARPKDKSAEASAEPIATADEPILKSESSEAVAEEDDETSVEEEVLQEVESAQEEQVEESENKAE